jgi:YbbR domain-containing protein
MLKLFSLSLAAMLWLTIASESNSVINRTVPLAFRGIPTNMEITGESATEVNLQLRGSSNLLNEISPADVAAVVSLAGQGPGTYSFNLTTGNIQAPFGVEVLRIDPPRVEFNLERTLTRTIRVNATLTGNVAAGYVVSEWRVDPPTAQLVGPESHVAPVDSLPTLPVTIEGARGSIRRTVDLDIKDPLVRMASVSPHDVFVEIREVHEEMSFRAFPAEELIADGWDVEPAEIMVSISGPRNVISGFDPAGKTFTVDVAGLDPGDHTLRPEIPGLGDGVDITAVVPERVTVRSRDR